MRSTLLRNLTLTLISIIAIASTPGVQSARPETIALKAVLTVEPLGAVSYGQSVTATDDSVSEKE